MRGRQFQIRMTFPLELTGKEQVTQQVTQQVKSLLEIMDGEMTRAEIQNGLGLKDRNNFTKNYLLPALENGLIEMTIPDKPKSSKQRYKLSEKGFAIWQEKE